MAKDVRTRRPNTPLEGGGTWSVAGCRNDVARLAHFSQCFPSGQHILMELRRIAMRAPCHHDEGSLHLVHADGPPCDVWISHSQNFVLLDMSGSSDRIFHIRRLTPDGRAGCFNFPGQTCLDPLIALTRRVSQPFCTIPRCSPEASWYVWPTFWDILL